MAKTVAQVLNEKIDEQMAMQAEAMVAGGCADYAAYKESCGVIRGLNIARREINDLLRELSEDSDD
jgi:hypothetical protein